jgi:hypothetical protein
VVNGILDLEGCTSLAHLPEGLVVKGDLDLVRCTSLTHLPSGLVVKGYLDLRGCTSLTHLPPGIVVKGTIYCDGSLIDSIPFEDLPLYINYNFKEYIHEYFTKRLQGKAA